MAGSTSRAVPVDLTHLSQAGHSGHVPHCLTQHRHHPLSRQRALKATSTHRSSPLPDTGRIPADHRRGAIGLVIQRRGWVMTVSDPTATVEREFDRVLGDRLIRAVFQPIVSVQSAAVVGYEGLVRGPTGSTLESPDALIKEAYRQNRVPEFDWIARAALSRAALSANLGRGDLLLINIEPLALNSVARPIWRRSSG